MKTNLIVFRFERVTNDHDEDLIFVPAKRQTACIIDNIKQFDKVFVV